MKKTASRIHIRRFRNEEAKALRKFNNDDGRTIRLYTTQFAERWCLQIRGPLGKGFLGNNDSAEFVIASADLTIDQMIALRNAISDHLAGRSSEYV